MKKHEHIVKSLMPGGIGEELGIEPGDKLLAINGNEIQDVFDSNSLPQQILPNLR